MPYIVNSRAEEARIAALMNEHEHGKEILAYSDYVRRNQCYTVASLIKVGANVNARNKHSGETVLQTAVKGYGYECAELLIKSGVDVSAKENDVLTGFHLKVGAYSEALHDVAATGTAKLAKLLIEAGAEVDAKLSGGYTPLLVAAGRGKTEVVRVLLDAGADVDATGESGKTALQLATERGYAETAKLIRERT